MSQTKVLSVLGILVLLAGLSFVGYHSAVHHGKHRHHHGQSSKESDYEDEFAAGDMAVDFQLEDLTGHPVTLSELHGKVVFLNVWATWCGPCLEEMPSMETLYDEFKERQDFVILAVSEDTKGRDVVVPYVAKNGYHFPVLLDPENKITEAYNVSGVPETFIIDKNGRIVAHHMGAFDWSSADVKEALRELLETREG
jgi:cytochrome c biogenesis protein CcmG/thiol:disulfide interchange protein DsbE